jgi:hypothetical protein
MLRNQRGFTMVEGLVAGAMVAGLGVAVMKMSQTSQVSQRGMMGMNELGRDLEVMRANIEEPQSCVNTFLGKKVNSGVTLTSLMSAQNTEIMKTDSMMGHNTYQLTGIQIGNHNPNTYRTEVHFNFKKMEKEGRSQSVRRTFYIFTKIDPATKVITECIDPLKNIADGTMKQTCYDADPAKRAICEENITNLSQEVKQYVCSTHPYLRYDPATKKCFPLDAGKKCPAGQYIRGWKANGDLDCYAGPPLSTPPSTCTTWSAWSPLANTQCPGTDIIQTRTCTTPGITDSETNHVDGTKTTGCAKLKCSISYQGRINGATSVPSSNGIWNRWVENQDHDCNSSPGCGINMGIACTGDTAVTLYYAFRYAGVETGERSTTSNSTGTVVYGGWHTIISGALNECDSPRTCGLKVRAVAADPAYKCSVTYRFRNEDYISSPQSDGVWSVMSDPGAGDDNCEKNGGCGMVASITCTTPP